MLELVELNLTKDTTQLFGNIYKHSTSIYHVIQYTTEHLNKSPEINFVQHFTSKIVLDEHRIYKRNIPADRITCSETF